MTTTSLDARVRSVVDRVLAQSFRQPLDASGVLDVDSLTVVALVDALEAELDLRFRPLDVTPEAFGTLPALVETCRRLAP